MKKLLATAGVASLVLLASCESDVTRPGTGERSRLKNSTEMSAPWLCGWM